MKVLTARCNCNAINDVVLQRYFFRGGVVEVHHLTNIGHGFLSSEIAGAAHGVAVILRISFHQQCRFNIALPHMRVFAIFFGKSDGIVDVGNSRVIRCYNKFAPLIVVGNFARELFVEVADYFRGGADVGFGVSDAVG